MALILNIDTATTLGSVSLAMDGKLLGERVNGQSMDHATWIHVAIAELLNEKNRSYNIEDLNAVAVVAGPGSYTGLRVGMATAKGLCYAVNSRLIALNTLKIMAYATNKEIYPSQLLCPMLDARRMEVFTALYDTALNELIAPCAMILDEDSFSAWLNKTEVVFFGSGINKWSAMARSNNAIFRDSFYTPADLASVSYKAYTVNDFADIAYTEPIYLKEFYAPRKLSG